MWLGLYVTSFLLQIWAFSALVWSFPHHELKPREDTQAEAEKYFKIMKPRLPGRCEGDFVETMVGDANALIDDAIMALGVLLLQEIPNNPQFMTWADKAADIWGSRHVQDEESLRLADGQQALKKALNNFKLAREYLDSKSIILTCGDSQWKWARTLREAEIPTHPGDIWNADTSIAQFYNLPVAQYPGLWFNPFLQNYASEIPQNLDANGMPGRTSFCNKGQRATDATPAKGYDLGKAVHHAHAIVICDVTLDPQFTESLADVVDKESISPRTTQHVDIYNVAGVTLVHEIMHIISDQIIDQLVTEANGETIRAYGWDMCVRVMQSGKALYNADSYALFALAVELAPTEC
ncbi:hypothetical protein N7492_006621 [Penicillium capsulatum]|uniref:Lysine-specific metallo-endopeptidase domain-containing protein n=1 Tax=Penicillium capsulatum TaxID=69766 RepID=A0A9W9HZN9_9EURO|nr:hypothetical protein N7492_006621 [Penicillium capsulatum]KAJ6116456.1 hypothetical protein N7512_006181 [Penicillium capsulatum]